MRLLGLGDNTVDIYVDRGSCFPGGNAVNVAVGAKRLGAEAGYLGCVGQDVYGGMIERSLAAEGVELSHLRRIAGPNPWCRIRHNGNDRIFDRSSPGVRGRYGLGAADGRYVESFDVVHTSVSSDIDADLPFVRRHARLLAYDFSERWRRPGIAASFPCVDIAFLSLPGAPDDACSALIGEMFAAGVRMAVVVTRGARGSVGGYAGSIARETIRPAQVVDTLGAGDAFIAGFLVEFVQRRDLAAALARGAENAALACGWQGGFGHGRPIAADDSAMLAEQPAGT